MAGSAKQNFYPLPLLKPHIHPGFYTPLRAVGGGGGGSTSGVAHLFELFETDAANDWRLMLSNTACGVLAVTGPFCVAVALRAQPTAIPVPLARVNSNAFG